MKKYIKSSIGKYYQGYVVQEYVPGYGWEDVCTYEDTSSESRKDAMATVRDYMRNGFNARAITRKFENPNYSEPDHAITPEEVRNYIENECPYPVKSVTPGNTNFLIGSYPNGCQIFIYDDNTVGVYNLGTNRTKTVYNLGDMIKSIDKIMK